MAKHEIPGRQFTLVGSPPAAAQGPFKRPAPKASGESLDLSYYTPATVAALRIMKLKIISCHIGMRLPFARRTTVSCPT